VFGEVFNPTINPEKGEFRLVGDGLNGHGSQGYGNILCASEIICQHSGNPQAVWGGGFL
jgi:hypothetical protein